MEVSGGITYLLRYLEAVLMKFQVTEHFLILSDIQAMEVHRMVDMGPVGPKFRPRSLEFF